MHTHLKNCTLEHVVLHLLSLGLILTFHGIIMNPSSTFLGQYCITILELEICQCLPASPESGPEALGMESARSTT